MNRFNKSNWSMVQNSMVGAVFVTKNGKCPPRLICFLRGAGPWRRIQWWVLFFVAKNGVPRMNCFNKGNWSMGQTCAV